jgi:hypothetical protein
MGQGPIREVTSLIQRHGTYQSDAFYGKENATTRL